MAKNKKPVLDLDDGPGVPEHVPVNLSLKKQMKVDVAVDKNSRVWALHSKPFPGPLQWVEFDAEDGSMVFITKDGRLNDLGVRIEPLMKKYIEKAHYIEAFLIKDNKPRDYAKVPLFVRGTLH